MYEDKFWEVQQMLQAWNTNMEGNFCPSSFTCLDESMSKWVNQHSCPGYMYVPRKPWPYGNKYHTICCCKSGIMFGMELVEGKDTPKERPPKEFEEKGKTVGLLLRLTKSLARSGRLCFLDSGFCVLKGIIALQKQGVFLGAY
jgi:hypothetical protein